MGLTLTLTLTPTPTPTLTLILILILTLTCQVDIKWGAKNEDGRLSDQTCKVRPRFRARVRVRLPPAAYPSPDTNPNPNPITLTTYYLDRGERARAALRGVEGQPRRHQVRAHAAGKYSRLYLRVVEGCTICDHAATSCE